MKLQDILGNLTRTENGALTYISTGNAVLDFYYHAAAKRNDTNGALILFEHAYDENPLLTLQVLFYLRDIRGNGAGERKLFRILLDRLSINDPLAFISIVSLIPEYGRWDDMISYITHPDINIKQAVFDTVQSQLRADIAAYINKKPTSLLAKWMPSENTSSVHTRTLAAEWRKYLEMTSKEYRKTLSTLRAASHIVEQDMSANTWESIKYSAVPSNASLRYRKAFGKHDADRYAQFIQDALSGKTKINSAVLYPYDLVRKYLSNHSYQIQPYDATVEAQWKSLPSFNDLDGNALVVADTSGSMFTGDSDIRPIDVAVSLAIYIAERNTGPFQNKYITFSTSPEFIELKGDTLHARLKSADLSNWGGSTNIVAVFDRILEIALQHNILPENMVKRVFIISDMEFNSASRYNTTFEEVKAEFNVHGYDLPQIVFWNVASRKQQTPVKKDEGNTLLVSGASGKIFETVMKSKAGTPLELMYDVLYSPRYMHVVAHIMAVLSYLE